MVRERTSLKKESFVNGKIRCKQTHEWKLKQGKNVTISYHTQSYKMIVYMASSDKYSQATCQTYIMLLEAAKADSVRIAGGLSGQIAIFVHCISCLSQTVSLNRIHNGDKHCQNACLLQVQCNFQVAKEKCRVSWTRRRAASWWWNWAKVRRTHNFGVMYLEKIYM